MTDIIFQLSEYLKYPFVKYALIVGVLIALCSSLVGVVLVLKRYSFIGDGLSHIAFGALALATVLRINNDMVVVLPVTIICAILMLCGKNTKKSGDSALAMFSVGALSIGYLLLNVFPSSSNISGDVCGTLFGSTSILTLSKSDVWICTIMSISVIAIFLLLYDKIFLITFDESFAYAIGIKVGLYNSIISVISSVIIVLAMNLTGSLLTSALIVFPAMSAMKIFKSFKGVIICSAILSVICASVGILASIIFSTPVGSTVVATNIIAFLSISLIYKLVKI